MDYIKRSYDLLKAWKGDAYTFGLGCLKEVGPVAASYGKKALLVSNYTYMKPVADEIKGYLEASGVELAGGKIAPDVKPNAPREDVYRLTTYVLQYKPDCIVAVGGGSTIDACKAASMLASLGGKVTPEIDAAPSRASRATRSTTSRREHPAAILSICLSIRMVRPRC